MAQAAAKVSRQNAGRHRQVDGKRKLRGRIGKQAAAQCFHSIGQGVQHHAEAHPACSPAQREQGAREQPQGYEQQVHDGVKGLRRIHGPGNGKAQRGQLEADHHDRQDAQADRGRRQVYSNQRRKDQEDDPLHCRQRGAPEHLAQNNGRPAHRRGQHREQKTLIAVLNQRHHAEDRCKEHNHGYGSGEKIAQVVGGGSSSGRKAMRKARTQHHPEDQGRGDYPRDPRLLAIETNNLPQPQAESRQPDAWRDRLDVRAAG